MAANTHVVPKIPSLPEHNARQGFFERGEFNAALQNLKSADLKDYLEFLYWTGMRPGEIRSLTWKAFDRESSTLRLHAKDAKSGHGRVIAVVGPLKEIIECRMTHRVFGWDLIFHREGKAILHYRRQWRTACKAAGVSGKIPYDLRRVAVRNMVRAGVPEKVAKRTRQEALPRPSLYKWLPARSDSPQDHLGLGNALGVYAQFAHRRL